VRGVAAGIALCVVNIAPAEDRSAVRARRPRSAIVAAGIALVTSVNAGAV
jgi:hypothetical protein